MSAHNWVRDHCNRCGATRTTAPLHGKISPAQEPSNFVYNLGDGLGALSTRPACGKGKESRHSRRAGRRAKVLARSRAGSPRPRRERAALVIPSPEEAAALVRATDPGVAL